MRLRIDLGYDGTHFHGWASQPGLRTVQEVMEEALRVVLHLSTAPQVTVAGRTDAGVHARRQVIHVDVDAVDSESLARLQRQLNGVLPDDVQVHDVVIAAPGFDARFSALARRYSYRVVDAQSLDPLERHSVIQHPHSLDIDALNAASQPLLGLHDFAAFCKRTDSGTSIRVLQEFSWHRDEYGVVIAHVKADAFCHSMVRSLVGALLWVGDGRRPLSWATDLLIGRERQSFVAPARGLILEEVIYPADRLLEERQGLTRQRRRDSELLPGGPSEDRGGAGEETADDLA